MNNQDWYELAEGPSLLQGDLLRDCPVFAVSDSLSWPPGAAADIEVEAKVFDFHRLFTLPKAFVRIGESITVAISK
mgnify:CR=1 FL=1